MKNIIYPNYEKCTLNIVSTLLNYYHVSCPYQRLPNIKEALEKGYQNIVLLVFDGMGVDVLEKNLLPTDFLNKNLKEELTAVVPSTTTAAMTAYYSGKSPFEHGWLGWSLYFKEYGRCIDTFLNTDSYTGEKLELPHAGHTLMGYPHVLDQIEEANSHSIKTYMIEPAHIDYQGKNMKIGVSSAKELIDEIEQLVKTRERKFIFGYWVDPDKTMHEKGCYSDQTKDKIKEINDLLMELSEKMEDTLLIVSADHGLIDVEPTTYLNDYPELTTCFLMPPFVEGRLMSFFIREDLQEHFAQQFNELFSDDFLLLTRQQALKMNLFGYHQPHLKTMDFIGDFIACATGRKILSYLPAIKTKKFDFTAAHAGLTREEMVVPLILVESK